MFLFISPSENEKKSSFSLEKSQKTIGKPFSALS